MIQKKNEQNKGISIISLVVIIIVMLILASITISTLFGDNGVIIQAENAKNATIEGEKTENNTISDYNSLISGTVDKIEHIHSYTILVGEVEATCTQAAGKN